MAGFECKKRYLEGEQQLAETKQGEVMEDQKNHWKKLPKLEMVKASPIIMPYDQAGSEVMEVVPDKKYMEVERIQEEAGNENHDLKILCKNYIVC